MFYVTKIRKKVEKVAQSCPTLCNPMDCTIHGILQARILEWVAFPFSREIFPTRGLNPGLPHCGRILNQLSFKTKTEECWKKPLSFSAPWESQTPDLLIETPRPLSPPQGLWTSYQHAYKSTVSNATSHTWAEAWRTTSNFPCVANLVSWGPSTWILEWGWCGRKPTCRNQPTTGRKRNHTCCK